VPKRLKEVLQVLKDAWHYFRLHDGPLLSGAVAFYALLALAPFGVIALSVATTVLGEDAARVELQDQMDAWLGEDQAEFLGNVIDRAAERQGSWLATAFSIFFLLFASTRLFWMLRAALNHMWGIRSRIPPGFRGLRWRVLRRRLLAFAMVFILGAALMVLAVLKAGLSAIAAYLGGVPMIYRVIELAFSVGLLTVIVAMIFRMLPDARIAWRDVFLGAFGTSLLATIGSYLIGHYVARVSPASMYGAAGSMVVLLLWVYYTAQIFFFGAEVTNAYAKLHGGGVEPLEHASRVVMKKDEPLFEEPDLL